MKLKVVDGNKLILPCVPGDKYYTIERITHTSRRICENAWSGELSVREDTKTIGKEIVEHTWRSYDEIVQALEVGRIGKNIFLKREVAKRKFEKYLKNGW